MINICDWNGQIIAVDSKVLQVPLKSDSYVSLTETIRVKDSTPLFLENHYFHLMASMRIMRMPIPMEYTPVFFEEVVHQFLEEIAEENVTLYFHVSIQNEKVVYWITAEVISSDLFFNQAYDLEIFKESHVPSGFYHQLYTPVPHQRIYETYAKENGYDDLFLLNESKRLTGTIKASVFLIQGENVVTPKKSEGAKDGVFRAQMLKILSQAPEFDKVSEEEIFPFQLQKTDEVFLVIEGVGIQSIQRFRKKEFETSQIDEVIKVRLEEALEKLA